ncbi:thioredoxin family protein [Desulfonatronum parangueonense]
MFRWQYGSVFAVAREGKSQGGNTFHRHITRKDIPVLVDFWAPWCAPCKMMAPAFEEAALILFPKVRLTKLNTRDAPRIGQKYGTQSIPTMVLFQSGKEKARFSGASGPLKLYSGFTDKCEQSGHAGPSRRPVIYSESRLKASNALLLQPESVRYGLVRHEPCPAPCS